MGTGEVSSFTVLLLGFRVIPQSINETAILETLPVVLLLSYYLGKEPWLGLEVNWFLCRNSLPMSKVGTQVLGRGDTEFVQIPKNHRASLMMRKS